MAATGSNLTLFINMKVYIVRFEIIRDRSAPQSVDAWFKDHLHCIFVIDNDGLHVVDITCKVSSNRLIGVLVHSLEQQLCGHLQHIIVPDRILIILKGNRRVTALVDIAIINITRNRSLEEKQIRRTHGTRVAVGHVHQVIFAIQGNNVPHMGACTGAADHITAHGVARQFSIQVAQVLERLGIALTDHVGAGVTVKHGDQLPGIDIRGEGIVFCSFRIIYDPFADSLLVGLQSFLGSLACVSRNNSLRVICRSQRSFCLGCINHIGVACGCAVFCSNRKVKGHTLLQFCITIRTTISARRNVGLNCIIAPIHIVRAITQQSREQLAKASQFTTKLIGNCIKLLVRRIAAGCSKAHCRQLCHGKRNLRRRTVTSSNLFNLRLYLIIKFLHQLRQLCSC